MQSTQKEKFSDNTSLTITPAGDGQIPSIGEIGLSQFVPYLMNRIMGRWNSNLQEHLAESKLSTVKMRILAVLSVNTGLTINQLSVYAVIEQSTISRSLDTLEEQGFIRRETSASDGRIREIYIMDKGRAAFNVFWPEMYKSYENLFSGIQKSEREVFIQTLHKLLNNIRENKI